MTPPRSTPAVRVIRHVVRTGESLTAIAARYGVPGGWARIYSDNRLLLGTNPTLVRAGQPLIVHATKGVR